MSKAEPLSLLMFLPLVLRLLSSRKLLVLLLDPLLLLLLLVAVLRNAVAVKALTASSALVTASAGVVPTTRMLHVSTKNETKQTIRTGRKTQPPGVSTIKGAKNCIGM
jgi:hypothetical protein